MGLICKPAIEVEDIVLEMDKQNEKGATDIIRTWGNIMPVVKIGEHILSVGELTYFDLNVRIGKIPYFTMIISDKSLLVRKELKQKIDKCVIFIGWENWYIKFNGIITNTFSEAGDELLTLNGKLYNELLYSITNQKSYKDKNLTDIFKDICTESKMGLYITDNKWINNPKNHIINFGMSDLEFFDYCIKKFTENLWCIDPLYHFHVGDITELRKKCDLNEYDMYTLDNIGKQHEETPIIFTSQIYRNEEKYPEEAKKIPVQYYTINSNFTETFIDNPQKMYVNDEEHEILSDESIGLGTKFFNTYFGNNTEDNIGFYDSFYPFYKEKLNKLIGGVIIEITLKNLLFEISPFDIVGFDCYLPENNGKPMEIDKEHSGNKIVIGYSYFFESPSSQQDRLPSITQKIQMI